VAPAAGKPSSAVYQPRDRELTLPEAAKVHQIAELFRRPWAISMSMDGSLSGSLERWRRIGGFHKGQDSITVFPLANLVSSNIAKQ